MYRARRDRISSSWYVIAILTAFALVGVGLRAWFEYYPASELVTAIGLPGPSAKVGTRCDRWKRRYGRLHVPTRRLTCWRQRAGRWPHVDEQQVEMDLVTRRVERASRSWTPVDSLDWQRAQDSVRLAVQGRGGVPLACSRRGMRSANIKVIEHWQVGSHVERLIAYHWTPQNSLNGEWHWQPWLLQLDAVAGSAPYCRGAQTGS